MNRTVVAVFVGLIAVLAAVGIATGGEDEESEPARHSSDERNVREVARGVERVRQLEFDGLPKVRRVSAEEAAEVALREIDAGLPEGMLEKEQRLLTLLGLLPEGTDLREVLSDAVSTEVGGLYVPSEKTMYLVEGVGGGLLGNVLLAHELTHALEDQHFGLGPGPMRGLWRDRAVADGAVQEGTATVAMVDYVALAQGGEADLDPAVRERALDALDDVALPNSAGLPRYMAESLLFPYVAGAQLVNRVEGGADWGAVDALFGEEGPVSSEQVMHPEKYESGERPVAVRLPGLGDVLPDGSERSFASDIGEWETEQFLREANGEERSRPAAAGWGGASFELWETPGGDVLALRWELDTPRDARELLEAARRSVEALSAEGAVVAAGPRAVAVGLAPEARLAKRVAQAL